MAASQPPEAPTDQRPRLGRHRRPGSQHRGHLVIQVGGDVVPSVHVLLGYGVALSVVLFRAFDRRCRAARSRPGTQARELAGGREIEEAERRVGPGNRQRIDAILRGEETLAIVFKPIVDLERGEVVGHEALARFPGGGAPSVWFAEAHAVGLGVKLELLAVGRALEGSGAGGHLSFQVSWATLASPAFRNLLRHQEAPGRLVVELTGHVMPQDHADIAPALQDAEDDR